MIVYPNSKINIGLNIERKRADSFHDISTLFFPVRSVCDVLEVVSAKKQDGPFLFSQTGLAIDGEIRGNLCVRAFELMAARCSLPPIAAHLHKMIPMGAGLGGGSADGAFMLGALNELVGSPLSINELMDLALQLGSDCPFFILNEPCVGRGRGEKLSKYPLNLSGYGLLLVNPGVHVNTARAYGGSKPSPWPVGIDVLLRMEVAEWAGVLVNDFEPVVFAQNPKIGEVKVQMYSLGAVYASMSGSGSTVYGIFKGGRPNTGCFSNYYCSWVVL